MYNTVVQNIKTKGSIFQKNGVPLYLQLASFIRRNIETGIWPEGMRMPSLETLAEDFDVARLTARQAVQYLVNEELLTSKQGRGTFVSSCKIHTHSQRLQTSWADIVNRNETTGVELLVESTVSFCPPIDDKPVKLLPSYHFMKRVHSRNNIPFCLIDVYLDHKIFELAPDLLRTRAVITVLSELNIEVGKARQILTVGVADAEAAFYLGIANGDPVAHVRRVAEYKNGNVLHMANIIYRGDQIYQEIDLLT